MLVVNPVQSDDDATGTTSQEESGENSERRTNDKKGDSIPARRSPCNDEPKGRPNGRKFGEKDKRQKEKDPRRNSELGKEASDNRKGPDHGDESRENTAQRILRRWKGQDKY